MANLYLLYPDFGIEQLTTLLSRLDDVADSFNIRRIVALGHPFSSASLRELNEAVAQFTTQKGNRLSLQIRYGVEN